MTFYKHKLYTHIYVFFFFTSGHVWKSLEKQLERPAQNCKPLLTVEQILQVERGILKKEAYIFSFT